MIAHPGGPLYRNKDAGHWSLVKGEVKVAETDQAAAQREFWEETGWKIQSDDWVSLGETVLRSRKVVVAWAIRQEFDMSSFHPGTFRYRGRAYPEIDRVEWVDLDTARAWLNPAQSVFIDRLEERLQTGERHD